MPEMDGPRPEGVDAGGQAVVERDSDVLDERWISELLADAPPLTDRQARAISAALFHQ